MKLLVWGCCGVVCFVILARRFKSMFVSVYSSISISTSSKMQRTVYGIIHTVGNYRTCAIHVGPSGSRFLKAWRSSDHLQKKIPNSASGICCASDRGLFHDLEGLTQPSPKLRLSRQLRIEYRRGVLPQVPHR